MKHFIVEITFKAPLEKVEPIVPAHREFLQVNYDKGIILFSGPKVPRDGGLIVARAESIDSLNNVILHDPYNLNGVANYRIIEFNPVKFQPFMQEWVG
jgi:uncharacterized protein YciI